MDQFSLSTLTFLIIFVQPFFLILLFARCFKEDQQMVNMLKGFTILFVVGWVVTYLGWLLTDHSNQYYASREIPPMYGCYLLVQTYLAYVFWIILCVLVPLTIGRIIFVRMRVARTRS